MGRGIAEVREELTGQSDRGEELLAFPSRKLVLVRLSGILGMFVVLGIILAG